MRDRRRTSDATTLITPTVDRVQQLVRATFLARTKSPLGALPHPQIRRERFVGERDDPVFERTPGLLA